MEIGHHRVWNEGAWKTVETIQVPNCFPTPWGYIEFPWNGGMVRWNLPDDALSKVKSAAGHFTMNCTFTEEGDTLIPTAVVVGDELIWPA